jgi:hypothetical protein
MTTPPHNALMERAIIDTTLAGTADPTVGRLSYVPKDQRSAATRRKPLLLVPMDTSLPAVSVTLQKALKLQHATLQLPSAPAQASAMGAVLSPSLPVSFDLRDPKAVMEAHALFGIKLHKEAATLFITKYLGDITPTQSSDCTTLLGCLSLYPCKRIVTLAPDATLSDSLMKRYGIALSSHTWPSHMSPPQFVPS